MCLSYSSDVVIDVTSRHRLHVDIPSLHVSVANPGQSRRDVIVPAAVPRRQEAQTFVVIVVNQRPDNSEQSCRP
jgi:hypothetical protein